MNRLTTVGLAPRPALAMGAAGALIGGSISAAKNIASVKRQEMTPEEAVRDVFRETGTTGLATAVATAVVGAVGLTGILSLAGLVSITIGTKYLADQSMGGPSAKQS